MSRAERMLAEGGRLIASSLSQDALLAARVLHRRAGGSSRHRRDLRRRRIGAAQELPALPGR